MGHNIHGFAERGQEMTSSVLYSKCAATSCAVRPIIFWADGANPFRLYMHLSGECRLGIPNWSFYQFALAEDLKRAK
jgi:hypothetical protein